MAIGSIIDILFQLENLGFFDFILPFLLMFAVVYGILQYMKIFGEDKAVHIIIAVVLGLISIRLPFYSQFLTEMSPRLAVGLIVLLALLILVGMFAPNQSRGTIGWILFAVGAVIFIVIAVQTFNALSYLNGYVDSSEIIGWVVMVAILIGVIVAIAAGNSSSTKSSTHLVPLFGTKEK